MSMDMITPTWIVETNSQHSILHAQLQQQLYDVFQTSFAEYEKEVFSKFAFIHVMLASDGQKLRPMHAEDMEKTFGFERPLAQWNICIPGSQMQIG